LGGRREALIRWRMFTDAISYRRICKHSQSLRRKKLQIWGSCFESAEPPGTELFENCAQKEIAASSGMKSIIIGSKTLPITQVDKVRWHRWPQRRPYRNQAKMHVFTDSCSGPFIHPNPDSTDPQGKAYPGLLNVGKQLVQSFPVGSSALRPLILFGGRARFPQLMTSHGVMWPDPQSREQSLA
jgi:hypothetical protein